MTRRMLIDAAHAEETRVVVVDGSRIEELDFESAARKQLRGNIYLAKVTRVEPSLQAAFIEYGGNRHGFLAFNEIHPDYYQIPVADREALMREVEADGDDEEDEEDREEDEDADEAEEAFQRRQRRLMRRYKIQDVIRRRQIMLVQVVKEERGNKGAALTTYLSLAGRYGVLMPNTGRGGGISRKIVSGSDRKRLKGIVQSLDVPTGMGLIIRTAGAKRTGSEINRDYDYLLRLWENIRETTLKSIAPSLIYEEEDLVKRAIRDMYDKDIDQIMVEGEHGYREARQFMRMIMPGQSAKISAYREQTPLFAAYKIEDQLAQMHQPVVPLRSGGYLVINQTEALVAIDVNSGKSTRERNIEATALKTNLEAAEEAARQLRLRDLAGLIVIDFIDMDEGKHNRAVEKVLKDCLSGDRARVQMGKISPFGLMEISRQRRRTGVLEGATHVCEHCQGTGRIRNVESSALAALRAIELEAVRGGAGAITVRLPTAVGLYVLNEKRAYLSRLEGMHLLEVNIAVEALLAPDEVEIERVSSQDAEEEGAAARFAARRLAAPIGPPPIEDEEEDLPLIEEEDEEDEVVELASADEEEAGADAEEGRGRGRRKRRRSRGRRDEAEVAAVEVLAETEDEAEGDEDEAEEVSPGADFDEGDRRQRRRRRGRRGGRRVREEGRTADPYAWVHAHGGVETPHPADDVYAWRDPHEMSDGGEGREGSDLEVRAFEGRDTEGRGERRARSRSGRGRGGEGRTPEFRAAEPRATTEPRPGPQVEAEVDPYVWSAEDGAESAPPAAAAEDGEAREGRGRSRRHRGGRGRGRDRDRRGRREDGETDAGLQAGDEAIASSEPDGEVSAEAPSSPAQDATPGDVAPAAADDASPEPLSEGAQAPEPATTGEETTGAPALQALVSAPALTPDATPEAASAETAPVADGTVSDTPAEAAAAASKPASVIDPPAPEAPQATAPEPQPEPEPDPNEITGQAPAATRRGWWRRKG